MDIVLYDKNPVAGQLPKKNGDGSYGLPWPLNTELVFIGRHGREYDRELGARYLEEGQVYHVGGGVVYDSSSTVQLQGILDEHSGKPVNFNTVMFLTKEVFNRKNLSLFQLRNANTKRLPLFKNKKGEIVHNEDGSDWKLSAWCNALTGEVGEAANIIKKIERGDFSLAEARQELGKELADVLTYLDILAFRAGIDLGEATKQKFNEVSDRVDCNIKL